MDDNALIKAAQGGDRIAFEQLLEAHYETIYKFALKWCGNSEDAQDITQISCVKVARGLSQFQFDSAFTTWLYRLVINCAKDWQRQHRHVHDDISDHEATMRTSDKIDKAVYLRQVLAWVEQLGVEFKETLVLVFGEGLSHGEAARVLQVKESTVSWRIHNVRQKLNLLNQREGA